MCDFSEKLMDCLTCPVCFLMAPDVRYFMCSNGHSICGNCQPRVGKECPQCRTAYPSPPTPNTIAQDMIALLDTGGVTELPCKNYLSSCPYTGPRRQRCAHQEEECDFFSTRCLYDGCRAKLAANQLLDHIASCHDPRVGNPLFDKPVCGLKIYFKGLPLHDKLKRISMAKYDEHWFHVYKWIRDERMYFYLTVNLSKKKAKRYEAIVIFLMSTNGLSCRFKSVPVFSMAEDPDSIMRQIRDSTGVLVKTLPVLWSHNVGSKRGKRYTHVLKTTVQIVQKSEEDE